MALTTLTSMLATKATRYWPEARARTFSRVNPPLTLVNVLNTSTTTGISRKKAA